MRTLPYICVGVGCGIVGGNTGTAIRNGVLRNNPQAAKTMETEAKDERNIAVRNAAKAKAYDLMVFVFGALMLAFTLMQAGMYIVLALAASYLFVIAAKRLLYRQVRQRDVTERAIRR